jgi:phage protein D
VNLARVDQYDEGDLTFLNRHCEANDLCIKLNDSSLWITSYHTLEQQGQAGTLIAPAPSFPGGESIVGA